MPLPTGPPAKRFRAAEDDTFVVPPDVVANIRRCLAEPVRISPAAAQFVMLCWNIDGIDESGPGDTFRRVLAVAEHIAEKKPAAVLLQECIPPQLELLLAPQVLGKHYDVICPENPVMPYYCTMLLHKSRTKVLAGPKTQHFKSSQMGRHFLAVDIVVDGREMAPVTLVTTHLESMKQEKPERVRQFTEVLSYIAKKIGQRSEHRSVILAGDLNIRDDEVTAARKAARAKHPQVDDIVDAWTFCGSPKDHQFTWDTSANSNLGVHYSSRCRFDRCLFSAGSTTVGVGALTGAKASAGIGAAQSKLAASECWTASAFELVGRQKIAGLGRYPSDHWGMEVMFSLASNAESSPSKSSAMSKPCALSPTEIQKATVLSDDERISRREAAAQRAEMRSGSQAKASCRELLAQGRLEARSSLGVSPGNSLGVNPVKLAATEQSESCDAQGDKEDESEDAIMARAIALSLKACNQPTRPSSVTTFQAVLPSASTVIDLD